MDEQIDLRPTVEYLLRRWWVPVGLAILLTAAAVLYAVTRPDVYEASTLVVISEPGQRIILDPRFEVNDRPDELLNVYPELALSDDVLKAVLPVANEASDGVISTLSLLRGHLRLTKGNDPRLLYLQARDADPALTSTLANAWAIAFVNLTNQLYGNQGGQVDFYVQRLADAAKSVEAAEAALIEFQGKTRLTLATNEFTARSELQSTLLAEQSNAHLVLDDINALRRQIAEAPVITFADQYTALVLQVRALGKQSETGVPQLQVTGDTPLTTADRLEQLALIDNLTASVEVGITEREAELEALVPGLLEAQQQIQVETAELARLTRDRDVASETYTAIARKLDEERLVAGQTSQGVQLASEATSPDAPMPTLGMSQLLLPAVVGFLLGLAVVFLMMWRDASQAKRTATAEPERRLEPATVE